MAGINLFSLVNKFNNYNNGHIERRNWSFSQSPHCAVNCLQHLHSSGLSILMCKTSSAYHVQHIVCHMEQRDSSAIKSDGV